MIIEVRPDIFHVTLNDDGIFEVEFSEEFGFRQGIGIVAKFTGEGIRNLSKEVNKAIADEYKRAAELEKSKE